MRRRRNEIRGSKVITVSSGGLQVSHQAIPRDAVGGLDSEVNSSEIIVQGFQFSYQAIPRDAGGGEEEVDSGMRSTEIIVRSFQFSHQATPRGVVGG